MGILILQEPLHKSISVELMSCLKHIDLKTCCVASSSDQQETKEALKRSLANWVYLCATVQQALKAGDGETLRNSRQRPLYL